MELESIAKLKTAVIMVLYDNNEYADVWIEDGYLCIDVNGDWKHDHLFVDWLIRREVGLECEREKITEEDGSDFYRATHYYRLLRHTPSISGKVLENW